MANGWRATALESDEAMAAQINAMDMVSYIEANQYVQASGLVAQANAPPGLVRLSHAEAGAPNYVFDDSAGAGITAYVVDTGILTTHQEFQGRATMAFNAIEGSAVSPVVLSNLDRIQKLISRLEHRREWSRVSRLRHHRRCYLRRRQECPADGCQGAGC
jgi:subtilisin family serine protease